MIFIKRPLKSLRKCLKAKIGKKSSTVSESTLRKVKEESNKKENSRAIRLKMENKKSETGAKNSFS